MPAAIFPVAILTFCADADFKPCRTAAVRRTWCQFSRAATGYRRHRRGEPATALIVCMQYLHHLRLAENTHWAEPLRQRVFDDALTNGGLINSLRVEPDLGSPARGGLPQTIASRNSRGWLINGHKIYTTGIEGLSWLALWARSGDNPPLVGSWLVPADSEGISVVKAGITSACGPPAVTRWC